MVFLASPPAAWTREVDETVGGVSFGPGCLRCKGSGLAQWKGAHPTMSSGSSATQQGLVSADATLKRTQTAELA